MPDESAPHVNLECTAETFRPHAVRWPGWDADFPLAHDFWFIPITRDDWLGFRADGYEHCAAVGRRQKGMIWTQGGSRALAQLKVAELNARLPLPA